MTKEEKKAANERKQAELELHKQLRKGFEFDRLKMYFGEDYTTQSGIVIKQPTIGDIIQVGEKEFYETLNIFVSNPTQYRLPLWQMGIDWTRLSDFELFCILYSSGSKDVYQLFMPDIDLLSYSVFTEKQNENEEGHIVLYNQDTQALIRTIDYLEISQYLRIMFNTFPKTEKAKGKATKEAIIWEDEQQLQKNKDKKFSSNLQPLVSACLNHPGFKYRKSELKQVGICEFMDSVQRLQIYENTRALLGGSYSGFCDVSKVDKTNFNFMRDIVEEDKETYSEKEKSAFRNLTGEK